MTIQLKKEFEYVQRTFFPRWDKGHEWGVRVVPNLLSQGRFNDRTKRVLIRNIHKDRDDLRLLLIHEICHFVSMGHGKKFLRRFLKAKDRAEKSDLKGLAEKISKQVSIYETSDGRIGSVYNRVYDVVYEYPEISWSDLLKYMAREYAMYPRDFLKHHKRAKRFFLSAKKDAREEEEARKNFERRAKGGKP